MIRIAIILLTLIGTAWAGPHADPPVTPQLGQQLPALVIQDKGEALIVDDELRFVPWDPDTTVRFFKDGALDQTDVTRIVQLLEQARADDLTQ